MATPDDFPYVTRVHRLEREDQSDDFRRKGNLSACSDSARAFCGHAGGLGDLGQLATKKKLQLGGPLWRTQTPSVQLNSTIDLMCIYKLVLFKQLAERR